jgi:hypothetical protein
MRDGPGLRQDSLPAPAVRPYQAGRWLEDGHQDSQQAEAPAEVELEVATAAVEPTYEERVLHEAQNHAALHQRTHPLD